MYPIGIIFIAPAYLSSSSLLLHVASLLPLWRLITMRRYHERKANRKSILLILALAIWHTKKSSGSYYLQERDHCSEYLPFHLHRVLIMRCTIALWHEYSTISTMYPNLRKKKTLYGWKFTTERQKSELEPFPCRSPWRFNDHASRFRRQICCLFGRHSRLKLFCFWEEPFWRGT